MAWKRGNHIVTSDGACFFPFDPHAEDLSVEAIAHALSNLCRFNGHTREFYSVAQHSVYVAQNCPPRDRLWGLLHDASEAAIGDMVTPLKLGTTVGVEYRFIEIAIMRMICDKFNLPYFQPSSVTWADKSLALTEIRDLMPSDFIPLRPAGMLCGASAAHIAWVAGMLEGEGSLGLSQYLATSGSMRIKALTIGIHSSDLDVLMRVQAIVGAGAITGPKWNSSDATIKQNKPMFAWQLHGKDLVRDFLRVISPYLGARRFSRAQELLGAIERDLAIDIAADATLAQDCDHKGIGETGNQMHARHGEISCLRCREEARRYGRQGRAPRPLDFVIQPQEPRQAREAFLETFYLLKGKSHGTW